MLSLIFICFQLLKYLVGKTIELSCFTPEICRACGGQCLPYLALLSSNQYTTAYWLDLVAPEYWQYLVAMWV